MDTLTFYKHPADPRVEYPQEISFTTAGSTAACGVVLGLGEEYLVSLYPDYVGQLTANSCGLLNAWEAVSGEDTLLLEAGCVEEDGCSGTCNEEHQVHLKWWFALLSMVDNFAEPPHRLSPQRQQLIATRAFGSAPLPAVHLPARLSQRSACCFQFKPTYFRRTL